MCETHDDERRRRGIEKRKKASLIDERIEWKSEACDAKNGNVVKIASKTEEQRVRSSECIAPRLTVAKNTHIHIQTDRTVRERTEVDVRKEEEKKKREYVWLMMSDRERNALT